MVRNLAGWVEKSRLNGVPVKLLVCQWSGYLKVIAQLLNGNPGLLNHTF